MLKVHDAFASTTCIVSACVCMCISAHNIQLHLANVLFSGMASNNNVCINLTLSNEKNIICINLTYSTASITDQNCPSCIWYLWHACFLVHSVGAM